jgi:hypothetical protein
VAYPYTLPADYLTRTNRIVLGKDTTEVNRYDDKLKDTPGNVANFIIGFIPILGDSVDLLTQVYNAALGKQVDPVIATLAAGGLVLDITTGGIGDLTAGLKGVYKISLSAGGFFSDLLKQSVQSLMTGHNVSFVLNELGTQFGTMAQLFFKSGFGGVKSADQLGKGMTNMPVCPLPKPSLIASDGIQTLANCDPNEISGGLLYIFQRGLDTNVSIQELGNSLIKVCCSPADGGKGYIEGAEHLVDKLYDVNQASDIVGIRAHAIAADSLRDAGFGNMKFFKTNSFTISGGRLTEPDLYGEFNGIKRAIEVKNNQNFDILTDGAILKELAIQLNATPTFMSIVPRSNAFNQAMRNAGIDVINLKGVLQN